VLHAGATTLIDEEFEVPDVPNGTANPAVTGWSWITHVRSRDSPQDGVPGTSGQQVIQFENTGNIARHDTTHGWAGGETYVLTLNASPQEWSGTTTREIVVSLLETNGVQLWTSGSVELPKYDSYGGNPWGARQTFSFVVYSDDFSAGTSGTDLRLDINSTGSRGLFFDNVSLVVTNLAADTTAPTPNALTWEREPALVDNTNTTMTCTFASDDFPYGVQHYFENMNTGTNSGWQDGVHGWTWGETDLPPGSTNSYRCKARDKSPNANETAWSSVITVMVPAPDTTPPNPDPMTWSVEPIVVDSLNIYMEATTAVDARYDVEYYFENVGTGSDSGWQSSAIWYELYQDYNTPLTYRVKARDISPQTNETAWSTNAIVTIPTPKSGLLIDSSFQVPTYSAGVRNPFFVGWAFDNGAAIYVRNGGSGGVPGASSNRVIEINSQGPPPQADYATDHPWSENAVYTVTVNAAPNSWNGHLQRYLDTSFRQVSDDTVLWSTNVPVPLYTNTFQGATPWPEELTFSFTINGSDFNTNGVEGEMLGLKVTQTGARSLYIDNVHLTSSVPLPTGSVFIVR
jgi:hypothetical protein